MDGHEVSTLFSTSLCMRVPDCHCSGLRLGQDQPPWYLPRHFYAPGYCGLLYYAMGYRPERQIRWYFPYHYWRVSRWSWFPRVGGKQCSRSCCPLSLDCLRGHAWYRWRYSCDLVRQITEQLRLKHVANISQDVYQSGCTKVSDRSYYQLGWSDLRVPSRHFRNLLLQVGEQATRPGQARPPSGWQNRCSDQGPRIQTP